MSEKDPARFQEPDRESEQQGKVFESKYYCVHCFQDKPESAMSVVDECCQTCLDRAFDRDNKWDIVMMRLRGWVDNGLDGKEGMTVVLSRIKAYLKGR